MTRARLWTASSSRSAPLPAPLTKSLTRVEDLGLESDDPYEARRLGLSPRP
ncbi:hypothetical protein VZQ01_13165 [Myxococcus faecalis]|uniref:hypothetical protein n=1 Tax=Myxococcus faecalis TaxID=3115646 RepID=UPI003CEA847D